MKKILIGLLTVVMLCSFAACSGSGVSGNNGFVTSQPSFIGKTSFGTYIDYVNLDKTGTEPLYVTEENRDKFLFTEDGLKIDFYGLAQDGNVFYGWDNRDRRGDLWRFSVADAQTVKKEVWVSRDDLVKSCLSPDHNQDRTITLDGFAADGDSVYATMGYDLEYMVNQAALNGRIARISKNGDSVSFVGDDSVRATELVVRDGWIYYADNGMIEKNGRIDYEPSKIGIYKIKTDGTEKTLLYSVQLDNPTNSIGPAGCLTLYKDYLYFLDLSDSSKLCRIKTDGSEHKVLSSFGGYIFTVDATTGDLYYRSGGLYRQDTNDQKEIIKISASDGSEKVLHVIPEANLMTFSDGALYVFNYRNDSPCTRIDPNTGNTRELIFREGEREWKTNESGRKEYVKVTDDFFVWVDVSK